MMSQVEGPCLYNVLMLLWFTVPPGAGQPGVSEHRHLHDVSPRQPGQFGQEQGAVQDGQP